LVDQPKGIEIEYRVIAVNLVPEKPLSWFCNRGKAGEGQASNTVMLKRSGNPDLSGVVL
jgi:hypothetical protein